eukprot:jgi/Tetstr1/431164/TSEL_020876.t1
MAPLRPQPHSSQAAVAGPSCLRLSLAPQLLRTRGQRRASRRNFRPAAAATAPAPPAQMAAPPVTPAAAQTSGSSGLWAEARPAPPLVAELAEAPKEERGGLLWPFPLPASSSVSGNAYLMLTYGYLLFFAAKLISEGSELLLEILNPGLVGGLLLPTLGALPDSLIVIASGMRGTVEEAQQEVTVGLGVLAGSTVGLLTLAWAASLLAGRCDLDEEGGAVDRTLTRGLDLTGTGVTTDVQTSLGARIMMLSTIPYIIVQIPLIDGHPAEGPEAAVVGAAVCALGFLSYSIYQVTSPWLQRKRMMEARRKLLRAKILQKASQNAFTFGGLVKPGGLLNEEAADAIFRKFDTDSDGNLDRRELEGFLMGLQLDTEGGLATEEQAKMWLEEFDYTQTNVVTATEFKIGMSKWLLKLQMSRAMGLKSTAAEVWESEIQSAEQSLGELSLESLSESMDENELMETMEEEEEGAEAEAELSPSSIARKAVLKLTLGVALVATFADPAVGTIGSFSRSVGVDPFLVAFVVTPLASNSSEVVSSLLFARKKRRTSISLCYSQIYGAITMNNTLCLGIFLAIVHLRGLTWDFSAEVTAMVGVILATGALGSSRQTFNIAWALPVVLLYPVSLAGVEFLEGSLGWN